MFLEGYPEQKYGRVTEPDEDLAGMYDDVLRDVEGFSGRTYETDPDLLYWEVEETDTSFYRDTDDTIVLNASTSHEEHVLAHEACHALQHQEVEDDQLLQPLQKEGFAQWLAEEITGVSPLEASESMRVRTGAYYAGRELYRAHDAVYGSEETLDLGFRRLEREDRGELMDAIETHGQVPYRDLRSIRDRL
jgi:hypothetical protein